MRDYPDGWDAAAIDQAAPLTPSPAANDDVPLAVRYRLPVAALAVVALLAVVGWLLTISRISP